MDEEREEASGGLSPKKVVAGAALGVAVPAAVGVARKLFSNSDDGGDDGENGDDGEDTSSEPTSRERRSGAKPASKPKPKAKSKPKPKARAKPKAKSASSSGSGTRRSNRTREQLYKTATRLKIEGRSAMSKAQLERAIERAKAR